MEEGFVVLETVELVLKDEFVEVFFLFIDAGIRICGSDDLFLYLIFPGGEYVEDMRVYNFLSSCKAKQTACNYAYYYSYYADCERQTSFMLGTFSIF